MAATSVEEPTSQECPQSPQKCELSPFININYKNQDIPVLLDSGASVSIISCDFGRQNHINIELCDDVILTAINCASLSIVGKTCINFLIEKVLYTQSFIVVQNISQNMILGQDFLKKNNAIIDFSKGCIHLERVTSQFVNVSRNRCANNAIYSLPMKRLYKNEYIYFLNYMQENESYLLDGCIVEEKPEIKFNISSSLAAHQREDLFCLLKRYRSTFAFNQDELGSCNLVEVTIETSDEIPVHKAPYRVSSEQHRIIQEQIAEMLKNNVIRESRSSYSSPVVLVKKPDNSWRFCVDFRALNKKVKMDAYPLPRIDDLISYLNGARYFADLDLNAGYWQLQIKESDKHKTAFITPSGLYEFNVLPFGLKTSGAIFQRTMDKVLAGLKYRCAIVYVDNIIVYGRTYDEFQGALNLVLTRLKEANLTLKPSKCSFGQDKISVLGYTISGEGILPDETKLEKIKSIKVPTSVSELKSTLGFFSYYRKFLSNFAEVTYPLTKLLRKDAKFCWTDSQQKAFDTILSMILSPPLLRHFNNDKNVITRLYIDASDIAIGACLMQSPVINSINKDKENNVMLPISFASRKLTDAEKKYSITEKECLGLIWATKYFNHYLWGLKFQVVTDHRALCWLKSRKDMTGRLARWSLALQSYDFDIVHCSGKSNVIADFLSRNPLSISDESSLKGNFETEDVDGLQLYRIQATQVSREQENDDYCRRWRNAVHASQRTCFKGHSLINNLLYKVSRIHGTEKCLLVLPDSLFNNVLQEIHDDPHTGGHFGLMKTLSKFRDRYFMPGATRKIETYVKSCIRCQEKKRSNIIAPLQPMVVENLFERIEIDILGPFNRSTRGNRYVIACIECFSKYALCRAVPRATAQAVSDFLIEEVFTRLGPVREILSDRGSIFTSRCVKETIRNYGARQILATTMHHQTLGLIERFNQTISHALAKYVDETQRDWCTYLPRVTYAYNCSKQASTKFSPYFIIFAREPRFPSDTDLYLNTRSSDPIQRRESRQMCINKVIVNLRKARLLQKRLFDRKSSPISLSPGQIVLLYNPKRVTGMSCKLSRPYKGLYCVMRRNENNNYVIRKIGSQSTITVHVNRLKVFHAR